MEAYKKEFIEFLLVHLIKTSKCSQMLDFTRVAGFFRIEASYHNLPQNSVV